MDEDDDVFDVEGGESTPILSLVSHQQASLIRVELRHVVVMETNMHSNPAATECISTHKLKKRF